jgi:hypothetical protein
MGSRGDGPLAQAHVARGHPPGSPANALPAREKKPLQSRSQSKTTSPHPGTQPRRQIHCQRVKGNHRIQGAQSKAMSLGWGDGRLEGDMGLSQDGPMGPSQQANP